MHDIETPAPKQHTHNEAPCNAPLKKSATFFQAPCSIKMVF